MGQYYRVINIDKKQYLHPHKFGDGLKLVEFGCSANATLCGLAILLAEGNGRGGGDLDSESPIIGSWARDRIVVAGDYADDEPGDQRELNLYAITSEDAWEDISEEVLLAMAHDASILHTLVSTSDWHKANMSQRLLDSINGIEPVEQPSAPLHVQLARAVLRNSEEPSAWAALLDACLERREQDQVARILKEEEARANRPPLT